jgi:hypothetical protein
MHSDLARAGLDDTGVRIASSMGLLYFLECICQEL